MTDEEIKSIVKSTIKNNAFDNIKNIAEKINNIQISTNENFGLSENVSSNEVGFKFLATSGQGFYKSTKKDITIDLDKLWKEYDKEKEKLLNSKDISQEDKSSFFGSIDQTFILNPLENKDIRKNTGHYSDFVRELSIDKTTGTIKFLGIEKIRRIDRKSVV